MDGSGGKVLRKKIKKYQIFDDANDQEITGESMYEADGNDQYDNRNDEKIVNLINTHRSNK